MKRNVWKQLRSLKNKALNKYTPEEDFILGILLGYDPLKQTKKIFKI